MTADATQLPEADIVLIRSKTKATKEYIDQAKKMKLIIRGGVGLDNVDSAYCKEKGIIVKNTPEASSVAVAELAFAMMIAVPNRLIEAHNSMKEGKWLKKELKRTELMGKTLGLIGCGRIGAEVAKRALAFGMKVIGYDPIVTKSDYIATEAVARRHAAAVRLHLAAHTGKRSDQGHDQQEHDCQDEERRCVRQHRSRQVHCRAGCCGRAHIGSDGAYAD